MGEASERSVDHSSLSSPKRGAERPLTVRVQRGPSEAARCASTQGSPVALRFFLPLRRQLRPLFCSLKVAGESLIGVWDTHCRVASHEAVCTLCFVAPAGLSGSEIIVMQRQDQDKNDRIADNLRRTIELTELGLALRRSVV